MDPENKTVEEPKTTEVVEEPKKEQPAKVEQIKSDEGKQQQTPKTKTVQNQGQKKAVKQKKEAQKEAQKEAVVEKKSQAKPAEPSKEAGKKIQPSKTEQKPKTMKCVMLSGPRKAKVMEVPIPKPASGEVLVKVMAAPINPSDLALYDGHYSLQKKFPTAMGFEGSGVVVQSGGGIMGWGLVGKKVAFGAQKEGQGTYSQYVIVKSQECLPLTDDTTFEQGSMSVVNPLTALALLDILNQKSQKCVVLTAAASALGRMANRIFAKDGIEVINVVRRAEQVQLLKKEGAKYVLNSTQQNFETELKVLAQKMNCKTCFECIGGEFTGIIVRNMPKNSTITVYGALSQQSTLSGIEVMDLLFGNKTVNGFMLTQWLKTKNQLTLLPIFYKVRSNIMQNLKSVVAKKFKLEQIEQAIQFYLKNMSQGKVIIEPWSD